MSQIRHVVMMRFKPEVDEATRSDLIRQYRALPEKIDVMRNFEWGAEGGVSERTEGFTHCFISTFDSLDDVRTYGPHPAHQEFVATLHPYLERILVFDFEAR